MFVRDYCLEDNNEHDLVVEWVSYYKNRETGTLNPELTQAHFTKI